MALFISSQMVVELGSENLLLRSLDSIALSEDRGTRYQCWIDLDARLTMSMMSLSMSAEKIATVLIGDSSKVSTSVFTAAGLCATSRIKVLSPTYFSFKARLDCCILDSLSNHLICHFELIHHLFNCLDCNRGVDSLVRSFKPYFVLITL